MPADMNNNDGTVVWAVAQALQDAGADIVTCVPGSGGTEVFDIINSGRDRVLPYSYHEEIAYTMAHGAAIAGKRAVVLVKSHGILKAANSVSDSLYCGVNAALLTIVFTDAGGHHSDTILDIRPFLEGTGVPWQIVQSQNAYSKVQEMILASERTRLPQVLIIESSEAGDKAEPFMVKKLPPVERQYRRDIRQHVLCPFFGRYQMELMQRRNRAEQEGLPEAPDIPEVPDIPFLPSAVPERWRRHVERGGRLICCGSTR